MSTNQSPRIPPLPTDQWDSEVDDALGMLVAHGQAAATSGPPVRPESKILGIYAWHPNLIRGWMPFSNHLRNSTLSDRLREIAIIRTTWLGYGEYEWAQHLRMSRAAGYFTDEELGALAAGATTGTWPASEAIALKAINEMCSNKYVSEPTWSALEEHLNRQQLIDLLFTVGTYDFHCMAFRTMGLEMEPGMERFPTNHRPEEQA